MKMRLCLILTLIVSLFCFGFSWPGDSDNQDTVTDIAGHTININNLKGKWVILNYWADWCSPCRREIPELNRFYLDHKGDNVVLLGISFGGQTGDDDMKKIVKDMDIAYPVLTQNIGWHWGVPRISAVPVTFVISPQGKIVKRLNGPQTNYILNRAISIH